ncbi:MAG TPA: YciI family protein [Silvibacterium sp.]|nr:YciI family protein [Silvibacterium sp.]
MSEFLYLYRGGDSSGSPEEMQQTMQKWVAWMKQLGDQGHLKAIGNPLEPTGKVVKGKQQKTITDGPYAEAKDLVGGYTLVQAKDINQAAELAKDCPIFDAGGLVEVRPILQIGM